MTGDVERCDVCGIWTRDPHTPHDRGCPRGDCGCDHVVCSGCCWDCHHDVPPWHAYDGCYGCVRGNAIGRKATS